MSKPQQVPALSISNELLHELPEYVVTWDEDELLAIATWFNARINAKVDGEREYESMYNFRAAHVGMSAEEAEFQELAEEDPATDVSATLTVNGATLKVGFNYDCM